jgi:hypothetical protein
MRMAKTTLKYSFRERHNVVWYNGVSKNSRTESIKMHACHCNGRWCAIQSNPLPSLCSGCIVSAIVEAPLELTFWNSV